MDIFLRLSVLNGRKERKKEVFRFSLYMLYSAVISSFEEILVSSWRRSKAETWTLLLTYIRCSLEQKDI